MVEMVKLLCESKRGNVNKGIAQVLVQMHSAIEEQLGKRKHGQMEKAMFGIVTTGNNGDSLDRVIGRTDGLE